MREVLATIGVILFMISMYFLLRYVEVEYEERDKKKKPPV